MDCKMIDISLVVNLVGYIEAHKNPCYFRLKEMSKKIRSEIQNPKRQDKSLEKTVCNVTSDINSYKMQLRLVLKQLKDTKKQINEVRQAMTYDNAWDDIVAENKTLKNKAEKLEMNNIVLQTEIEKLSNTKEKEIQTLTKEKMHCKSCNTELAMKLKTCQNQVEEMKLRHEKDMQDKDLQIGICRGRLQKHIQINKEKDQKTFSNEKNNCAEKVRLHQYKKKEELADEIEELLKTLFDIDKQLDAVLSPQKMYPESLPTPVEKCFTKHKDNGKTSCLKEVALSIRNKLKLFQRNIDIEDKEIISQENVHEDITKILAHFENMEAEYRLNVSKLNTELQEKDAHITLLKGLINVDAKHAVYKQEMLNSGRRLAESKEKVYNIKNEELCQLKTNNKYLKIEIGRIEVKLREQEEERGKMLRKLKESDKHVSLMEKENAELHKNLLKYGQIKIDLEKQLQNLNKKSISINERHVQLVKEKDEMISELDQTIYELQRNISFLTDTEKSLNIDLLDKDNRISMLYNELEKCTKTVKMKEIELQEMENNLQTIKSNLNKDSNFYETEIAQKDQMLVKINERMNKMEEIEKTLRKEVAEKDAKLDILATELQHRLENDHITQKNLEDVICAKEKLVLDLEKKVDQRDAKVYSLEKELEQYPPGNIHGSKQKTDAAVTNEISELKKQLNYTLSKLHDTQAELDDTKTRLSKAMGSRLTDNNPNITDLSDRNRPTKLAEKCAELYDNQWTDAFEILEKKYFSNDEAVIDSLLHILQVTMNFCRNTAEQQLEELERTLQFADKHGHENTDVSNSVHKQLKDTRKAAASSALENLRKMFVSYLKQSVDQSVTKALETEEFTFECLELCWFMMVNDPPVAFAPLVAKGTHFNSDLYKPYTSSGTHVEYVVWPSLLLHEGGPILAKGVAQGINKSKKVS